ncbi:MAG: type II CAAX prenyl endopeptidase Rce1 family protein [Promethearchaeota archaeon]
MEDEKLKFYSLAKYPNYEVLMDSQLNSAGANQARLLEKYARNKNYIKTQYYMLKFVFAFLFIFLPLISLIAYFDIVSTGDIYLNPLNTVIFTFSYVFGMLFINLILYVFLLGMFNISSFMTGSAFKWLQTLPLSKKSLKKLGYMTLLKTLDIPLISMILSFPIIMLIITKSFLVFIACLIPSIINVLFSFSLLIIISEKISHVFYESSGRSKKKHFLRIIIMLAFFALAFGTSFIIQFSFYVLDDIINVFPVNESALILNLLLSLIPYPLAPGYLVSMTVTPGTIPFQLIITSIIGVALFALLSFGIYRLAIKRLRIAVSSEFEISKEVVKKEVKLEEIKVEVKTRSTISSYIRKDLVSSTRDIQTFMFLLMPIIYPIIILLSMQGIVGEVSSPFSVMILWTIILGISMFLPIILVIGLLNIEESGSSIVASLPILPRDQAKAKILLMAIIQSISYGGMAIMLTLLTRSLDVLFIFLVTFPISLSLLLFLFEMKVRLFGRMKYKYIIEELNKENKIIKWVAIILSEFAIYFLTLIIGFNTFSIFGLSWTMITLGLIGLIQLGIFIFIFFRMFPKEEKIHYYVTGGFLRKFPIIGISILSILYVLFQFIAAFSEILFFPLIVRMNYVQLLFFDFSMQFGFLALLLLVITPKGLKLPNMEISFNEYLRGIRLTPAKHLLRNIFIGIGAFLIFGAITYLGSILLGTYTPDLSVLFGNPDPTTFLGLGWFLFIFMLIPGIWEEFTFRGVAMPMLLKKYKLTPAIIINGIIFGLIHSFNAIMLLVLGYSAISVLFQVIYAAFLGFAFAYLFVKSNSLIPVIILHYLIDSVGRMIYANTIITNLTSVVIYTIFFIGVIPSIVIILLVWLLFKDRK